jgi:superoxide dismutase
MANPDIKLMEERAIKLHEWLKNNRDFKNGTPEQQADYQKKAEAYKFSRQAMTGGITVSADKDAPYDFSAKKMMENLGPSAKREMDNIAYAITNPGETLGSLGNLLGGVIQKLDPTGALGTGKEQYVEALAAHYTDKYGSFNRFKRELQENPVGVLGDASLFISGGATGVRLGANVANKLKATQTASDISKVAGTVGKVGASLDPLNIAINAPLTATGQVTKGLEKVGLLEGASDYGANLYGKALKPSLTMSQDQRKRILRTAVDEKLPITPKGTDILQERIDVLNNRVNKLIDTAVDENVKIPSSVVFKYFDDLENQVGGFKIEAKSDINAINKIKSDFIKWQKKIGKDQYVTPKELQDFKVDVNRKVNWKTSNLKSASDVEELAYKNLGRGAKQGIAENIPEIANINADLSRLLELQPYLIRGADRVGQRDIFGIGGGIKATGGRAVAGDAGAAVGAGAGVLDFPGVKSRLGIAINEYINNPISGLLDNKVTRPIITNLLTETGEANYGQGMLPFEELAKLYK